MTSISSTNAYQSPLARLQSTLQSDISTGSIHGWIWVPLAFAGTIFGLRIRRRFGF